MMWEDAGGGGLGRVLSFRRAGQRLCILTIRLTRPYRPSSWLRQRRDSRVLSLVTVLFSCGLFSPMANDDAVPYTKPQYSKARTDLVRCMRWSNLTFLPALPSDTLTSTLACL